MASLVADRNVQAVVTKLGIVSDVAGVCSFLSFYDPNCVTQPWFWGDLTGAPDGGDDIENLWDLRTKCPAVTTSSSSSSTMTSTTSISEPSPSPSPYEQGNPQNNSVKCYNSGETTEDVRMQNAAASFCGDIENDKLVPEYFRSLDFPFPYNSGVGTVTITISMQIKSGCSFDWDRALCEKYLSVLPADSCNCAGVNGKQGGILENNI